MTGVSDQLLFLLEYRLDAGGVYPSPGEIRRLITRVRAAEAERDELKADSGARGGFRARRDARQHEEHYSGKGKER